MTYYERLFIVVLFPPKTKGKKKKPRGHIIFLHLVTCSPADVAKLSMYDQETLGRHTLPSPNPFSSSTSLPAVYRIQQEKMSRARKTQGMETLYFNFWCKPLLSTVRIWILIQKKKPVQRAQCGPVGDRNWHSMIIVLGELWVGAAMWWKRRMEKRGW